MQRMREMKVCRCDDSNCFVDSWGMQPEFCSFEKTETRIQEPVSKRLSVVSRLPFIQEQLFALFDLVPGLEYCDVQRDPHTNSGK